MPTAGQMLQWIVICLLGLAVVMVGSAGMSIGGEPVTLSSILLGRSAIYAMLAIAVMGIVGLVDVRRILAQRGVFNLVVWMMLGVIVLLGVALIPGLGRNVNGASRWLYLGPRSWGLSFQPSELAKWAMVVALAWYGARRAGAMHRFFAGLLPAMMLLGVVCGLIVIEDLGTAVLIGAVGVMILLAAGARIWQMLLMAPAAMAGVYIMIVTSPYRLRRITSFLNPFDDPEGSGYHLIQSLVAIAGGGVFGRGAGNGLQKFGYLPEDTTDFLFAVICEELGIAGACLVIGLYLALIWVGLGIVRDSRGPAGSFCRLLGAGVVMTIGFQAMINLAVVTGLMPTKGIALPLLSSGGTGWVLCAAAVGLLVAIDRLNQHEADLLLPPEPVVSISASQYA